MEPSEDPDMTIRETCDHNDTQLISMMGLIHNLAKSVSERKHAKFSVYVGLSDGSFTDLSKCRKLSIWADEIWFMKQSQKRRIQESDNQLSATIKLECSLVTKPSNRTVIRLRIELDQSKKQYFPMSLTEEPGILT